MSSDYSYTYYKTSNTNEYDLYEIPVSFIQEITDTSVYHLKYIRNWNNYVEKKTDTIKFKFDQGHLNNSDIYFTKDVSKSFLFAQRRVYINGSKNYTVYKFYNAPQMMDAGEAYFWTPEFGVILIRSLYWENIMKLECHKSESLSKELDQLCTMVLFDKSNFFNSIDNIDFE
ncbi:hypothetical protein [Plebeiibacterium sediminum]|uniref:Uncharacterized protein n=1 Tax=Plebeiibacterium sediminum TaxID=2992112 RepID=A0AAE3SE32_9BACT|nr:hypothetical protein [Plebeiobacterium sediminum]MCW3785761.1 hypothetical protein [Plebeiobacterium sediminum]